MSRFVSTKMTVERDGELEITISGVAYPGTRDVYYLPNGDPGYPGDPPEIVDLEATYEGKEFELTDDEIMRAEYELFDQAAEDRNDELER